MKYYVMVRDEAGNRFNPRVGGYEKKKCVYALTKKFPVVEVRTSLWGSTYFGYWKGTLVSPARLRHFVEGMLYGNI